LFTPWWLPADVWAAGTFGTFGLLPIACQVASAVIGRRARADAATRRLARHSSRRPGLVWVPGTSGTSHQTTRMDHARLRATVRVVRHHGGGVGTSHVVP